MPWAAWGARHGYFEVQYVQYEVQYVQYMDGLPYLSALAAPAA